MVVVGGDGDSDNEDGAGQDGDCGSGSDDDDDDEEDGSYNAATAIVFGKVSKQAGRRVSACCLTARWPLPGTQPIPPRTHPPNIHRTLITKATSIVHQLHRSSQ